MSIDEIDNLPPIFFPSDGGVDERLFYPLAKNAIALKCMVGYFSSGYVSELARSISIYLNSDQNKKMSFVISPNLDRRDVEEIKRAYEGGDDMFGHLFPIEEVNYSVLQDYAVKSLAYLVNKGRIELKVALKKKGIFHTKCWIFTTHHGEVAVHGSSNATQGGMLNNFEQLVVSRSWRSEESQYICQELSGKFDYLWQGGDEEIRVLPLNKATVDKINSYAHDFQFDEKEVKGKLGEILGVAQDSDCFDVSPQPCTLKIPTYMNYQEGDFKHQGEAVKAWFANECVGILAIATGGGKTYTSLIASTKLLEKKKSLLVVVAVPTKTLIDQWEGDVAEFGISAINTNGMGQGAIARNLKSAMRKLRLSSSKCEVVIVTHDALCSNALKTLEGYSQESMLLIADEVHNLGGPRTQENIPTYFKYKLGLSATHERQFDPEGTDFLVNYFGGKVYEFGLRDAIGKCLVEYDYFVYNVYLSPEEEEEFQELTHEIKRVSYAAYDVSDTPAKERWQRLCLKRRSLVESSSNKIKALENTLNGLYDCKISKALIFCTDKKPEQLVSVNKLLIELGIMFHQVTAEETSKKAVVKNIIESFSSGELQAITSKRVLDEGFNLPQTELAFILASNTVKRQWTQRLGRVLRMSPKTGKKKAVIHDYLVIPVASGEVDEDLKSLIESEYKRVAFFTQLSSNKSDSNGGMKAMNTLMEMLGAL
ncbi:DEAD/DEAH box helicase family protein [Halomonas sp. LR5S13]|uniref:DEAD/DEAH box helicase family protein n=1 Tax=Halomonas rhizosphaerae TaxID=3043296 RepID=UPI0024A93787|nr:DEAD/DEAH box helicase family protein [Halomonas rhizosphaerae]MDI5922710.1 DEAD/DEAH box helicase family protein [Halomonas rhizosphaerae]